MLWVRARFPRLVFVTTSELMQLKGAGWSREVFPAYWSGLFRAMRGLVLPPLCNEGSLTWHHVAQVWHDRVVLRNHNAEVAEVTLPRHSDLYCSSGENPGSSCRNAREEKTSDAREDLVFVREVRYGEDSGEHDAAGRCWLAESGSTLELRPGTMYVVRAVGTGACRGRTNAEMVRNVTCQDAVDAQRASDGGSRQKGRPERMGTGSEHCGAHVASLGPLHLDAGVDQRTPQRIVMRFDLENGCNARRIDALKLTCSFEDVQGMPLGESAVKQQSGGGLGSATRRGEAPMGLTEDPTEWVPPDAVQAGSVELGFGAGGKEGAFGCDAPTLGMASIVRVGVWQDKTMVSKQDMIFLPAELRQLQPRALHPPSMAVDPERIQMLMHRDVEMQLRQQMRLCLFCGAHALPGWINLQALDSELLMGRTGANAQDDSPPGRGARVGRQPGAIWWRSSDGLQFAADGSAAFITLGPELGVDWGSPESRAALEALLDECWRVLAPGAHLRVVRPAVTRSDATASANGMSRYNDSHGHAGAWLDGPSQGWECESSARADARRPSRIEEMPRAGKGAWWRSRRRRCDAGAAAGDEGMAARGCRGQPSDVAAFLDALEAVGLVESGADELTGQANGDAGEHRILWPYAAGGMSAVIFHAVKPG